MNGSGPGAAVAWAAIGCASLIVAALVLHAVWCRGERRLLEAIEADRVERADRIAAAAFAASELAARKRHPTWPSAIPADQVDRWFTDADTIREFSRELADWDGDVS